MRVLNKCAAAVLAFCLIFASAELPGGDALAKDLSAQYYVDLFTALKIYDDDDSMDAEGETVRREEAAGILSVFYGVMEKSYPVKTEFVDVPEYWASGHIMTMVNNGIMSGYNGGLFRPEANVKKLEAVKMLVNMTGYKAVAEMNGGWPLGYVFTANKIGLFKGVSAAGLEGDITRGEFNRLLYNAVNVDIYRQNGVNGEYIDFVSEKGITLLTENLDIYKTDGILNGAETAAIDFKDEPGKGRIRIDNTNFNCDFDALSYLGTEIRGYYKKTRDDLTGKILYLEEVSSSEVKEVDAADIVSLSANRLEYQDEKNVRSINIPSDAVVIYNGKRNMYNSLGSLKPVSGSVRIVAANGEKGRSCVIIENYVDYVVMSVAKDGGMYMVSSKDGKAPFSIDTSSDDTVLRVYDRGRSVMADSISPDDVISVRADSVDLVQNLVKSESHVFKIHRSANKISGTYNREFKDREIAVDDARFKLAADYNEEKYPLAIGRAYTFYLNYKNEICGYAADDSSDLRYGILIACSLEKMDTQSKAKIYDQGGEFVVADLSEKIIIDGKPFKDAGGAVAYLKASSEEFKQKTSCSIVEGGVWQLVKYKKNADDEIFKIDTIMPDNGSTWDNQTKSELRFSGRTNPNIAGYYTGGSIYSPPYVRKDSSGTVVEQINAISVAIPNNILIFDINGTDLNDQKAYGLFSRSSFISTKFDIKFFDTSDMNMAKAAIRYTNDSLPPDQQERNNMMVIGEFYHAAGDEGGVSGYLKGYSMITGNEINLRLENDEIYTASGATPSLETGDIIQWNKNGANEAVMLRRAVGRCGSGNGIPTSAGTQSGGGYFNYGTRFAYGTVKNYNGEYILMSYKGLSGDEYSFVEADSLNNLKCVYIHDSVTGKLIKAAPEDLRYSDAYGEADADKVACVYYSGRLSGMIIYR